MSALSFGGDGGNDGEELSEGMNDMLDSGFGDGNDGEVETLLLDVDANILNIVRLFRLH